MKAAGSAAQVFQAWEIWVKVSWGTPEARAWSARAEWRIRSDHMPPHQAAVGGVGEGPVAGGGLDLLEAGGQSPGQQTATGIGFAAVGAGHSLVQRHPLVQLRQLREPREGAIVRVARRDDPARLADAPHLAQRLHRVGNVLQDLVRVHHVVRVVRQVEPMNVTDDEVTETSSLAKVARVMSSALSLASSAVVRPGCTSLARSAVMVPGPAPISSRRLAGPQMRQQVARRVLGSTPAVRAQYGFVVAVRVHVVHLGTPSSSPTRSA